MYNYNIKKRKYDIIIVTICKLIKGCIKLPIKIPEELPAYKVLNRENIFVMNDKRADTQDIRPLKIAILNLMPKKIISENQLLRYLSNSPLQVEIT